MTGGSEGEPPKGSAGAGPAGGKLVAAGATMGGGVIGTDGVLGRLTGGRTPGMAGGESGCAGAERGAAGGLTRGGAAGRGIGAGIEGGTTGAEISGTGIGTPTGAMGAGGAAAGAVTATGTVMSGGVGVGCAIADSPESRRTGKTVAHTEQRARTPRSGTLAGSTRKTVEQLGQRTFMVRSSGRRYAPMSSSPPGPRRRSTT